MKTSGQTILITGGTSGIGFELARQLLERGNTVLITGRDEARLSATRAKLPGVHTFVSDVADPTAIDALFEQVTRQFPALNVLINNAGQMRVLNLRAGQTALDDLTREIQTNLIGPMHMNQRFLPHLTKQPEAAIVNVTSGLAFVPMAVSPIYCASKAGLHSYTQSLRAQLKGTPVRVFELAPPATKTPLDRDFPAGLTEGIRFMDVTVLVNAALRGLEKNRDEILPGLATVLRWLGRLAPRVALLDKAGTAMLTAGASA